MYLHLGADVVILKRDIVGIFDLDTTTISKHTKNYLALAEKNGKVVNVSYELPKSFVVICENGITKVYISQLSSQTLLKRFDSVSLNV
ncbi:MAG: DUF370 domain-containing protein [Clostridia bacterium]|nr:DUF370 domain-containing protein [Clostridia bacterium]